MLRLARLSVQRPRVALLAWALVALALSLVGLGLTGSLSPSITTVAGSSSSRAQSLAETQFGPSVLVPILLEGPAAQLDRQGPALVRALSARGDTRVLSAWDGGDAGAQLRPKPTAAMIVAAVARTEEQMVKTYQKQIDRTVDRVVAGPVSASITGQPSIDRAMKDQAIEATRLGMALTLPALFLVLLVLLRAPVAALALSLLGTATAFTGLGAMTILGKVIEVDATSVALGSMTGLALGTGYGLVLYRRWQEEINADTADHDAAHAATAAVQTTGRGILIGGTALIVSLALAPQIVDNKILTSVGIGTLLCAVLAVGAAVVVMPAFLVLAGHRTMAFSFGAPASLQRAWERLAGGGGWVVRRAVPVGAVATAMLAALAIPVLSLDTGPPSVKFLPKGDSARTSFERVAAVMGAGWPTPYNIVLVSKDRPVTDAAVLRSLDLFQASLARDKRISSVVGPGDIRDISTQLAVLPKQLQNSSKLIKGGKKDLGKLQNGLSQAGAGVVKLRSGLSAASGGAGQLQGGSGKAQGGAGQLHAGLEKARSGASQISNGLTAALTGARKLRDGASAALEGSSLIQGGLGQAAPSVKNGLPSVQQMSSNVVAANSAVTGAAGTMSQLNAQLDEAAAQLQKLSGSEPAASAALGAIQSARNAGAGVSSSLDTTSAGLGDAAVIAQVLTKQVGDLSHGLGQLYTGSTKLRNGLAQLKTGNASLASGIEKLAGGGGQLTVGLIALRDGAGQLENGLGQLTGGAGQLATGLSAGTGPTGKLRAGLGTMEKGIATFRGNLPSTKDLERLQAESPGLFQSGYFVLAAVAGATDSARNQASFAVDLEGGGNAGQITVIPRYAMETPATQHLGEDLQDRVEQFAAANRLEGAVGGPAGSLADFHSETAAQIWPAVIAISLLITLLMMALLRTVVLPLVAVAFDLLTAAAAFGVLTLLFNGSDPLLGGPGYIDPMSIVGIFAVVFGVTMVYEVQLLQRTREAIQRGSDAHEALREGLRETAAAGTGAAIAMVAAIAAFASTDLITVREFGIGVAVAVILDALIVRPVLLPAAAEVLGRLAWWPSSKARPAGKPKPPPRVPSVTPLGPVGGTPA